MIVLGRAVGCQSDKLWPFPTSGICDAITIPKGLNVVYRSKDAAHFRERERKRISLIISSNIISLSCSGIIHFTMKKYNFNRIYFVTHIYITDTLQFNIFFYWNSHNIPSRFNNARVYFNGQFITDIFAIYHIIDSSIQLISGHRTVRPISARAEINNIWTKFNNAHSVELITQDFCDILVMLWIQYLINV